MKRAKEAKLEGRMRFKQQLHKRLTDAKHNRENLCTLEDLHDDVRQACDLKTVQTNLQAKDKE